MACTSTYGLPARVFSGAADYLQLWRALQLPTAHAFSDPPRRQTHQGWSRIGGVHMLRSGVASTAIEVLELHVQPATPSTLNRGDCGRGAVDESDEGDSLPLRVALDRWFIEPVEADAKALAAWNAVSEVGRVNFFAWEKSGRKRFSGPDRARFPDGRLAEYPFDILPLFTAAQSALEAGAEGAMQALRAGKIKLTFKQKLLGAKRESLGCDVWQDVILTASLSAHGARLSIERPGDVRRRFAAEWDLRTLLLERVADEPKALQAKGERKTATPDEEKSCLIELENWVEALPSHEKVMLTKRGVWQQAIVFQKKVKENGFNERIWPKLIVKHPFLSDPGRKPQAIEEPPSNGGEN